MIVNFMIPGPLRDYAGGAGDVAVDGEASTVGDALSLLWQKHPAIRDRIVTEQGDVRPHVNIFVDGESIRFAEGLRTQVKNGASVVILPAVSGG